MAASHPTDVDRRFPAEPATVAAARREMETLGWALDAEESSVVALLVSELVTNSVQHAATSNGDGVRLEAHVTDAVLRVSVTDGGDGFVAPFRSEGSPLGSHWGLHVVDALVDRWEIARSPSTVVSFEIDRHPPPDEAADAAMLDRALAEQSRLSDAYSLAIGTSSEMTSYERLRAATRQVVAVEAALERRPPR